MGVTQSGEGDTDYEEIIKRCDEALYRAKSNGRDQAIIA
jgi:PleD family two-component response regulator